MAAASPTPAASTVSASSVPSVGPHVAQNNPQAVHMAHQQFQGYHRMAQLLAAKHPERRNVVETQLSKTKAIGALVGADARGPACIVLKLFRGGHGRACWRADLLLVV